MSLYLLQLLGVSVVINGILFVIAFGRKSDKLTDASYALSFMTLAVLAFAASQQAGYNVILLLMVLLWALRIGSFLLYRVLHDGRDRRFDAMRNNFWKFGKFWLGQAVTVWVLMLPYMMSMRTSGDWNWLALSGVVLWAAGFIIEGIADVQKYEFTHRPSRSGHWIDSGVWRYSRHPNYFGEILVWIGVYLFALPGLSTVGMLVGAISPLFISALLLFVSGIPPLEQSAEKRWGRDPGYQAYKKRTSILIPWPPRSRND